MLHKYRIWFDLNPAYLLDDFFDTSTRRNRLDLFARTAADAIVQAEIQIAEICSVFNAKHSNDLSFILAGLARITKIEPIEEMENK